MRPPFYVRQLRRDLDEWIKRGLVPESSRAAILESAGAGQGMSFASILGILGAILIGAAAMSFVADNWERMPKLARLMVLFGGMWLAFGLGWFLAHGRPVLSQAFVLLGVLLFGANIMLVAQTYHINAHYPDGILLWAGGAMAAAALIPSRASLALAIGLGALWTHYEHFDFDKALHWQYLGFWALGVATAIVLNWRPAIQLSAVALIYWAIISTEGLRLLLGWSEVEAAALYVLIPLVLWAAANALRPQAIGGALTVEHYAFLVFLVTGFILHFIDRNTAVAQSWMVAAGILSFGA
ncbi:MAG TPA: hypothetical protein DCL48_08920, partial [Alphaproteobacteria bacterium]|nr:hypothetical protein [Alphaproteobacteria bacterium]